MTFDHVWQLVEAFNQRFPDGNTPFQLTSRLAEECGELAEQVNMAEIHGIANRFHFAKSFQRVDVSSFLIKEPGTTHQTGSLVTFLIRTNSL